MQDKKSYDTFWVLLRDRNLYKEKVTQVQKEIFKRTEKDFHKLPLINLLKIRKNKFMVVRLTMGRSRDYQNLTQLAQKPRS